MNKEQRLTKSQEPGFKTNPAIVVCFWDSTLVLAPYSLLSKSYSTLIDFFIKTLECLGRFISKIHRCRNCNSMNSSFEKLFRILNIYPSNR